MGSHSSKPPPTVICLREPVGKGRGSLLLGPAPHRAVLVQAGRLQLRHNYSRGQRLGQKIQGLHSNTAVPPMHNFQENRCSH